MNLIKVLKQAGGYIREGYQYNWKCFGDHAWAVTLTKDDAAYEISVVYDLKSFEIFQIEVFLQHPSRSEVYRWIQPKYLKKVKKEHQDNDVSFEIFLENFDANGSLQFQDVDEKTILDILSKAGV